MSEHKSFWDKAFLRTKDVIIISTALFTFFAWGTNFLSIPKRLEAAEVVIQALGDKATGRDTRISNLEKDISFIRETLSDIKKNQELQMRFRYAK